MFSAVEQATARAFARILVIVLAAALLCGSFPVMLMAREVDRTPCEMPGDGEDINGYKNFEFENNPVGTSYVSPNDPYQHSSKKSVMEVRMPLKALLINLYLTVRK